MAPQTDIPDLSDDDKALVFHTLDVDFNQPILFAFLQGESLSFVRPYVRSSSLTLGIYTGMVAFTLSRICLCIQV